MKVNALEKITINANTSDLGKIDLIVEEGFYTTRTEFIKTGIKLLLDKHEEETKYLIHTKSNADWVIGVSVITKNELEIIRSKGQTKSILCMGLLVIDKDFLLNLLKKPLQALKFTVFVAVHNKLNNTIHYNQKWTRVSSHCPFLL